PYPTAAVKCGDEFGDWRTMARMIHSGDTKALSLNYMRDQWRDYKNAIYAYAGQLPRTGDTGIKGGSAELACKNATDSLHTWWHDMADECNRLQQEIQKLADAHDTLVRDHPTAAEADEFDSIDWRNFVPGAKAVHYLKYQKKSEEALAAYGNAANMNP
ncbi:hypothetical protein IMZ11_43790, partial [Microtetraspora sp. AC03309]|nr:hypothetical protein [Microtetraspora sp. AC03309]